MFWSNNWDWNRLDVGENKLLRNILLSLDKLGLFSFHFPNYKQTQFSPGMKLLFFVQIEKDNKILLSHSFNE